MTFDAETTVNDVLRQAPAAAAVLNQWGIDMCCGGGQTLAQAARSAGRPVAELLAALRPLAGAA